MSTRYAEDNSPLDQERYMSSPEYAELRGVMGNAVTAKASILASERKRSLLFSLQSLSLERGGLRALAERVYETFPGRVGTKSMIATKVRPGDKLTDDQVEEIYSETHHELLWECCGDSEWDREQWQEKHKREMQKLPHDADHYFRNLTKPTKLAEFLVDLCVNPRLLIPEPGLVDESKLDIANFIEAHEELRAGEFRPAEAEHFHDICGALYELQRRDSAAAAESFARTTVAKKVIQTLDACLYSRRMVLIEGESDSGKSTSAEAWCRMHKGEARFVRLQGVTNKTVFFRAIARALGVASTYTRTAKEMQARVEDVLQRSGLTLVLDESQYAFAQSERIYSRPEIVDWIYTACCNHGVPVALIATPLFSKRLHQAEKQTIWNSDQFKRRIFRYEVLPAKPTRADIEMVVKHHLPDGDSASQKFLAGYAATATHPFTAIADTLADAALLARAGERSRVTLKDLMEAVGTFRASSELAKRQAFAPPSGKGGRSSAAQPVQTNCSDVAAEMPEAGEQNNFTERSRSVTASDKMPILETGEVLLKA